MALLIAPLVLALAGVGSAYPTLLDGLEKRVISARDLAATYDYIVVGGGQSGLVIGSRLSEDTNSTVLVVEYGYFDDNPGQIEPSSVSSWPQKDLFNGSSAPMTGLNNISGGVYAAAVVGGGSTVNGMMFDRGAAEDYDNWEALDNPGWGWKDLLPYFKKSTTFTPPDPDLAKDFNITWDVDAAWGTEGPIHASFPSFYWPGAKIQWKAFNDIGIPSIKEGAGGGGSGVFWNPDAMTPDKRQRSYSRTGYYDPASSRSNFNLLTGYRVNEVQFSSTLHADNITIQARDTPTGSPITTVKANKEIILCAGWLHTPHVLQRSGIGPKALLTQANIPIIVDLPGVGSNFQDHAVAQITYQYSTDAVPNPSYAVSNATFRAWSAQQWTTLRKGPQSIGVGNSLATVGLPHVDPTGFQATVAKLQTQTGEYLPTSYTADLINGWRVQRDILAKNFAGLKSAVVEMPFSGNARAAMSLEKPTSRGTVTLQTTDKYAEPILDYGTFTNPVDVDIMIAVFKFARKWYAAQTELGPVEQLPGANIVTDADLATSIKQATGPSTAHGCCTAAMMPRHLGGVISPELLVYGVTGLSVGDISTMPLIPGTHTCSTVYAIAEKAADLIKARHKWTYSYQK